MRKQVDLTGLKSNYKRYVSLLIFENFIPFYLLNHLTVLPNHHSSAVKGDSWFARTLPRFLIFLRQSTNCLSVSFYFLWPIDKLLIVRKIPC